MSYEQSQPVPICEFSHSIDCSSRKLLCSSLLACPVSSAGTQVPRPPLVASLLFAWPL